MLHTTLNMNECNDEINEVIIWIFKKVTFERCRVSQVLGASQDVKDQLDLMVIQ